MKQQETLEKMEEQIKMAKGVELDFSTYRRKHWERPSSESGSEGDLPEFSESYFQ